MTTPRIATYARVSTTDQADTGTSLADQERRLKAAVIARDGRLVEHFVDAGISGAVDSRPGLDRLRKAVRDEAVDLVMATKIDRVSRSAVGLLALIEELRESRCHLLLIDEGLDTSTSAGDLTSGLLGVIGGWERRRIAERTKAGRRAAAELEGRFVGSTPPFGYRVVPATDGKGKRLSLDDRQAATVRKMYELLVREKLPVAQVARLLNEHGHLSPTHRNWTAESLGRWSLREQPLRAASGIWRFDDIDVTIPRILTAADAAIWQDWQQGRRNPENRQRGPYLLSGLLFMPCDRPAMGRTAGRQRATYSCRRHYLHRGEPERHDACLNVPCSTVDAAVVEHVRTILAHPQILREAARERLGIGSERVDDLPVMVAELRSIEQTIAAEAKLFRAQGYSGETLLAVLAPLHDQRQNLLRRMSLAQRSLSQHRDDEGGAQVLASTLGAGLDAASRGTWREILVALDVTVRVEGYETCRLCCGAGYLTIADSGGGRRWPKNCSTCLRGKVPQLTIVLDDLATMALTEDVRGENVITRSTMPAGSARLIPELDERRRGRTSSS